MTRDPDVARWDDAKAHTDEQRSLFNLRQLYSSSAEQGVTNKESAESRSLLPEVLCSISLSMRSDL